MPRGSRVRELRGRTALAEPSWQGPWCVRARSRSDARRGLLGDDAGAGGPGPRSVF